MIHSFPPVISQQARILILGSMPGIRSLEQQQYYAHPQNQFWWIIAQCYQQALPRGYQQKLDMIYQNKLALWDVLGSCERSGSLDNAIVKSSEQANDIPGLLQSNPTIKRILFNGQKARQAFERHIHKVDPTRFDNYRLISMPSTSAANARQTRDQKLSVWSQALL